jgi:hypothetical protein
LFLVPLDPQSLVRWLWLAWLVSWFVAALWSDRTIDRPGLGSQLAFRLPMIAGAILLFGLHSGAEPTANVLWRPGAASTWALVGLTAWKKAFCASNSARTHMRRMPVACRCSSRS